jgi:serine/threonine protein kinase
MLCEILVLSLCSHRNVVNLLGWVDQPYVCVILEYMPNGSLRSVLDVWKNKARDQVGWTPTKTQVAIDVASGVVYLHANRILHRDLKADNCLTACSCDPQEDRDGEVSFTNRSHRGCRMFVKVSDFGSACRLPASRSHVGPDIADGKRSDGQVSLMARKGSPRWMAPEILASERDYDEKVDVWAFGALLCEVLTTQLPYTDSKGQSFFQLVKVAEGALCPLSVVKESQVRWWGLPRNKK